MTNSKVPISSELSFDQLGRLLALEDVAIIMMGLFLSDEQRERLRSVLPLVRQASVNSEVPPEIGQQIAAGRALMCDRIARILDVRVQENSAGAE